MRPRYLLLLTLIPVLALAACSDDPAAPPGPAVRLVFAQVPAVVVASSPFTVTVHAARADGSVDDAFTDPITISLASGSGTLSGTTTLAATAGKATFTGLTVDQEGSLWSANTSRLSSRNGAATGPGAVPGSSRSPSAATSVAACSATGLREFAVSPVGTRRSSASPARAGSARAVWPGGCRRPRPTFGTNSFPRHPTASGS